MNVEESLLQGPTVFTTVEVRRGMRNYSRHFYIIAFQKFYFEELFILTQEKPAVG